MKAAQRLLKNEQVTFTYFCGKMHLVFLLEDRNSVTNTVKKAQCTVELYWQEHHK